MSATTLTPPTTRPVLTPTWPTPVALAAAAPAPGGDVVEPSFIRWARTTGGMVATSETGMSVVEAIKEAGLDYLVTSWGMQAVGEYTPGVIPERIDMDGYTATMRVNADGTKIPLGVVRSRYAVTQNASAFAFSQELIDNFDTNVVAAAAYGAPLGSRAYLALKHPRTMHVGGEDPHDVYVVVHNSHDGSSAVSAEVVAVRRATGIEVSLSTGRVSQKWTLRHSGDIDQKYADAVDTTRMVEKWIESYEGMTRELLSARFGPDRVEKFVADFLPTPRGTGTKSDNTWGQRRATLLTTIRDEVNGHGFGSGSAMAVFNATCSYIDHQAATRGANPETVRLTRAITGRNVGEKQKAWTMLRQQIRTA